MNGRAPVERWRSLAPGRAGGARLYEVRFLASLERVVDGRAVGGLRGGEFGNGLEASDVGDESAVNQLLGKGH